MSGRLPASSFTLVQALIVAAIVLVSSFGVGLARLLWTEHNLQALEAVEQGHIDQLTQAIAQLEKDVAYAKTDDYVREWARETGKLIQPGEVPVVVVAPAAPTAAASAARSQATATPEPDAASPRWRTLLDQLFAPQEPGGP